MTGKRSNPAKIREARLKQAFRDSDPETQAIIRGPSLAERILGPLTEAIQRKRVRRNPSPPDIRGATVIGHKKYGGIV